MEFNKVIQKIRDRLTNDNNKDWDFWLTQPPYLQPFTEFSKKLALINERIKNRPSIPKIPDGVVINEWFYLQNIGDLFSQFVSGTKVSYQFQPVEKIQEWVKQWNPWALISEEDWNARRAQTKVLKINYFQMVA